MITQQIERFIFWSRWLLAPLYLGLIVIIGVLVVKFCIELYDLVTNVASTQAQNFVLGLLGLLDLVLLANLILIVLFAGYENFVSKIGAATDSVDRPAWMGYVDFSGLKIKLIGSLVAISVIELLKDFLSISANPGKPIHTEAIFWQVMIHLTFVLSGVLFAVMDWISDTRVRRTMGLDETSKANQKSRTVI